MKCRKPIRKWLLSIIRTRKTRRLGSRLHTHRKDNSNLASIKNIIEEVRDRGSSGRMETIKGVSNNKIRINTWNIKANKIKISLSKSLG